MPANANRTSGDAAVARAIPAQPVNDIDAVLGHLRQLQHAFPRRDGIRFFNRLYLEVTEEILPLVRGGKLERPEFVERLDVLFANAYFEALRDASDRLGAVSPAWRPVFERRLDRRVAPIQFALGGMNAHVNFDLPVGIVAACEALSLAPEQGTPQHRDFLSMNAVMRDVQEDVKRWLLTGLLGRLDRFFGRVDDVVAAWSLNRARDASWMTAQTLWELRSQPALATAYTGTLSQTIGFAGRNLLQPSVWGFQRFADRLSPTWSG